MFLHFNCIINSINIQLSALPLDCSLLLRSISEVHEKTLFILLKVVWRYISPTCIKSTFCTFTVILLILFPPVLRAALCIHCVPTATTVRVPHLFGLPLSPLPASHQDSKGEKERKGGAEQSQTRSAWCQVKSLRIKRTWLPELCILA